MSKEKINIQYWREAKNIVRQEYPRKKGEALCKLALGVYNQIQDENHVTAAALIGFKVGDIIKISHLLSNNKSRGLGKLSGKYKQEEVTNA